MMTCIAIEKRSEEKMDKIDLKKSGKCDEEDLLEYITDNDINIAIAAAESLQATEPILDIAARDSDKRVRLAAINNPNVGKETVRYLLNDSDFDVAERANDIWRDMC